MSNLPKVVPHQWLVYICAFTLILLQCSGNRLHNIPVEISRLKCLRSLDVSNNKVFVLPKELCEIETLESIIVDVAQMRYPCSGCTSVFLFAYNSFIYLFREFVEQEQ